MDLEEIRTCCELLEQDITALRMTERIKYNFYSEMIDAVQTIAAEITAPPKSNGDRIRQMTDEELAEWFAKYMLCNECERRSDSYGCDKDECTKYALLYMKQEVSEDDI